MDTTKKAYVLSACVLAGIIVVAVAVAWAILATVGGSGGAALKRPRVADAIPAVEVLERYAKSKLDAELFYANKTIAVEGTVQRVYEAETGLETGVMLADRTADGMPIAIVGQFFGRDNRNLTLALHPGEVVAIRGECKGNFQSGRTGLYHVILYGARMVGR